MVGSYIRWIVNWAVTACHLFPRVPILASKINFKSAFQQMHLNAATALQTFTQFPEFSILLMWLCLSFGGKPCPYMWGVYSETICDLANAIMHSNHWDRFDLFAPNQPLVSPQPFLIATSLFGEGVELIVDIPINPRGSHDLYINDIFGLTINIPGTNHVAHR